MGCGCSNGGNTNNDRKETQRKQINTRPVMFDTTFGKILYFIIGVFICVTPIINIIGLYFFFKAIFGTSTSKKHKSTTKDSEKEIINVEINKNKNYA